MPVLWAHLLERNLIPRRGARSASMSLSAASTAGNTLVGSVFLLAQRGKGLKDSQKDQILEKDNLDLPGVVDKLDRNKKNNLGSSISFSGRSGGGAFRSAAQDGGSVMDESERCTPPSFAESKLDLWARYFPVDAVLSRRPAPGPAYLRAPSYGRRSPHAHKRMPFARALKRGRKTGGWQAGSRH